MTVASPSVIETLQSAAPLVLARGNGWVAVNKPVGISVHESSYTGPRDDTLLRLLKRELRVRQLHAVHRLDTATSGVLLLGRDPESTAALAAQFEARTVGKSYLAVVRGYSPEYVEVNVPLPGVEPDSPRKPALTRLRTLARVELPIKLEKLPVARYSLVRAEPETGRYHQIRRHLKHLAHPIVGDVKYGKGEHNRVFRQHYDVHRLLLHAIRLSFNDPKTNERVEVTAPLDAEYERAIRIFSGLDRSTL